MRFVYGLIVFLVLSGFAFMEGQNRLEKKFSPANVSLEQNFPNPYNPTTFIEYYLPEKTHVELNVYNILGRKLFKLVGTEQEKGWYSVHFDAGGLPTGLYLYELSTTSFRQIRKMLFMK